MSFNKRYVSKETILSYYKSDGISGVIKNFNSDAVILDDEFSRNIEKLLAEKDYNNIMKLISKQHEI